MAINEITKRIDQLIERIKTMPIEELDEMITAAERDSRGLVLPDYALMTVEQKTVYDIPRTLHEGDAMKTSNEQEIIELEKKIASVKEELLRLERQLDRIKPAPGFTCWESKGMRPDGRFIV